MKLYASTIEQQQHRVKFDRLAATKARTGGELKDRAGNMNYTIPLQPVAVNGSSDMSSSEYAIAVFQVKGCLVQNTESIDDWWEVYAEGGTDLEELYNELIEAEASPFIKAVILEFNSGGGDVQGTQLVANLVRNFKKPIIAAVNGIAASAAYWIAAQCKTIYATSETAYFGSVGVYTGHCDNSGMYKMIGKEITYVPAILSTEKLIGMDNKPLSDTDFAKLQERVSKIDNIFIRQVKEGRGDKLKSDEYQNAGLFVYADALQIGLVDEIATPVQILDNILNQ